VCRSYFEGGHDGFVTSIALLDPNDPRFVVSGSEGKTGGFWAKGDGGIKVWRVKDGKCVNTVSHQTGDISAFHFSRGGGGGGSGGGCAMESPDAPGDARAVTRMLSASRDGTVVDWQVAWKDVDRLQGSHDMKWRSGFLTRDK